MARKKKKDAEGEGAATDTSGGLRLRDHPRAQRSIRTVKGAGGLVGFVLGALLARRASLPFDDVLLRALIAGIGTYLAAWGVAVVAWRQIARAELAEMRRFLIEAAEAAEAEAEARRAAENAAQEAA